MPELRQAKDREAFTFVAEDDGVAKFETAPARDLDIIDGGAFVERGREEMSGNHLEKLIRHIGIIRWWCEYKNGAIPVDDLIFRFQEDLSSLLEAPELVLCFLSLGCHLRDDFCWESIHFGGV